MTTSASLPRGTVTFLFTDIESSARLLEGLDTRYRVVLHRHRELLSEAFASHGGVVFGSEGDSLCVAFETASGGVAGALAGQLALASETWPPDVSLRVRMGIHSGEVELIDGDYVGMTVHIAARVSAAAHGGQVIMTDATAALAGRIDTIELGRHRLKDVGELHLLQLRAPGLQESFSPLRTLSGLPNNLPAPVDSFVGREMELAEIASALAVNRLVTLTGPGGSGKTRLALEAAASMLPTFPGGVWLVPLASLDDGSRLVETVAQAFRVNDKPGEDIVDTLQSWLQDREILLILDNCEHLIDEVAGFCERFLRTCGDLRILATSREFLGVRGEHEIRTPPLAVPDNAELALLSDAVQLFVARAAAASPSFRLTAADRTTVAHICLRLDGLPLAIELAAARLRAVSLPQLAARLDDRFRLLTGGSRTDVPRQRTLEAVVAWSYDLLSDTEQATFSRLAVFPDHFTLEMAEGVVSEAPVEGSEVFDLVSRLVAKSLVTTVNAPDGLRYQLLETLREYARERLAEHGEVDRFRERLFAWAMSGVEHLEAVMRTPAMDDALREAAVNAVTYRVALQWATEHGRSGEALRIVSVVPLIHHRAERRAEILELLGRAEREGELAPAVAGQAWAALGNIEFEQSDWGASLDATDKAFGYFQAAGLGRLAAWARYLGVHSAWGAGQLDEVDRLVGEATSTFRGENDDMGLGYVLWVASLRSADPGAAEELAAEADGLLRRVGVPMGIAHNVEGRGIIAYERGELGQAAGFVTEAVETFAWYGNLGCTAHALEAAAVVIAALGKGDSRTALELLAAAEDFRNRSGQGHRPWEIRARLGSLEDLISAPAGAAAARAPHAELQYTLSSAASLATNALRQVGSQGAEVAVAGPDAARR